MMVYTLPEIRNGTGFGRAARFVQLEDVRLLVDALGRYISHVDSGALQVSKSHAATCSDIDHARTLLSSARQVGLYPTTKESEP